MRVASIILTLLFSFTLINSNEAIAQVTEDDAPAIELEGDARLNYINVDVNRFEAWLDAGDDLTLEIGMAGVRRDLDKLHELRTELKDALRILEEGEADITENQLREFKFLASQFLSTIYGNLYRLEDDSEAFDRALSYSRESLDQLSGVPDYEDDLAFPKLGHYGLLCHRDSGEECTERLIRLTEEYETTPYGDYPEWFAARMVLPGIMNYAMGSEEEDAIEHMLRFISETASGNDVMAVSASILMIQHYLTNGDRAKAEELIDSPPVPVGLMPEDLQSGWERLEEGISQSR
ncbi:MAG: hypothetical protein LAT80_12920 [Balneolaceae bacterium]|nr:hypothetical protein [Balneolaceae bacterium]